jgi:hypothetical protein
MEDLKAENVRELVLILLERMRVMEINLVDRKSHISSKTDAEVVSKLEGEIEDIKRILQDVQKKQSDDALVKNTNDSQKEKDKQRNADTIKIISGVVAIAATLYFVFKQMMS